MGKTMQERLAELSKIQEQVIIDNELQTQVFPVKSGTKDIKNEYIGRKPTSIKEIHKNYPEYGGTVNRQIHLQRVNKGLGGNISRMPHLFNRDDKIQIDPLLNRVIGMERAGGKGVMYAGALVEKREEISDVTKASKLKRGAR